MHGNVKLMCYEGDNNLSRLYGNHIRVYCTLRTGKGVMAMKLISIADRIPVGAGQSMSKNQTFAKCCFITYEINKRITTPYKCPNTNLKKHYRR